jgi:signal transduction histidine kinase
LKAITFVAVRPVKNSTTLILMSSSIILLLVLQGFWLFNSYEKAFHDFRKETDGIFRNTVMAMRDSSLLQHIETLPSDSLLQNRSTFIFTQRIDSTGLRNKEHAQPSGNTSKQLRVIVTSTADGDSLKEMLKPIVGKIHEGKMKGGNFMIRMSTDSLRSDSIGNRFAKSLTLAGKLLPFKIKRMKQFPDHDRPMPSRFIMIRERMHETNSVSASVFSDTLKGDWVRTDPVNRYAAVFTGLRLFMLQAITPQILFSLFLSLLTTMAFVVMHRSMQAQQRLMEIKNDFISNVTHELKTPVTTVSVALEALRNFKGLEDPKRTEEYLNIAQRELNRLTILTDKILKTAVFENKGVNFEPEPVDLFSMMEQVLHSMKLVFEKQKAQVTFQKTGNSFTIHGGSVHLTNVIYNLLDNALKYSEGEPQISVSLIEHDSRIIMTVADRGIGIPKEYSKKIFEKFFRVPVGDVHNVKGYGLGLSYVESVIKSHKGQIMVESETGRGSVFTISFPKNLNSTGLAVS